MNTVSSILFGDEKIDNKLIVACKCSFTLDTIVSSKWAFFVAGKEVNMGRKKKNPEIVPIYEYEGEKVVEVETSRLRSFDDHPYKVVNDEMMKLLMDSIQKNGIITPLIVTPTKEGNYCIISGHRRRYCARALGLHKVPVIIRTMPEEDSVITMVDSNLQRQSISYSEKAFAYKMKNEALKQKVGKRRKTSEGRLDKLKGENKRAVELISEECGDSPRQITRYIRLTYLIPELLEKLDAGHLSFNPAVDLSFLSEEEQKWVLDAMNFTQAIPSLSQTHRIRDMSRYGTISEDAVKEILSETKKSETSVISFSKEQLYRYFPKDYTPEEVKREILEILDQVFEM